MTIVTKNSLTLSNVNDGTITHTAYAYSADGKDRFTNVYPNLNLGDNTKTFVGAEGDNNLTGSIRIDPATQKTQDGDFNYLTFKPTRDGYDWFRFFLIPDPVTPNMKKITVKPNTNYTFSVWLKGTGQHTIYAYQNWTAPNTPWFLVVNLTSDWKLYTFTVTSNAVIPSGNVQFFIRSNNETEISLKKPKVEEGSIATPWMPSSSEVKTSDYPNYIGTYLDRNVESSSDYKRYQWTIFKGQDSNAYTAYSWSVDGTDRFSTTYPSLNLLKGTKVPASITGNNTANQGGLLFPFDNDKTLANQGFNINDILTLEFDWSATNPASGTFILQWQGTPWDLKVPTIKLSSTNGSGHVIHTYNIRAVDIASTAYATGIGYRLDNIPTNTVITFSNVIIRKANGSQPWMPSESEVQDQWQDAIPMYVGVGEKDSQNPTDYRWQLNPRYVQASSDSGLSNKAGLDDLASVANTANDALVQAQNAVSNEDYTSWLEHDYQTTIDNLQDVSVQNQEDIKNVDDRTTIVEGFYGEMKVKWNFIDESFSFSEEGMFISNAQSKMSIQITSDKIVFWDNNVDVAFITGEVLNIQKGVFLESATIGNHLITKFSDSSPVTIIRYVGGIT